MTISHHKVYIGYPLDWNSRIYPQGDYYESAHGRMQAHFYDKIDPKLNVLEENRVWPLISNLDEIDERIIAAGGVDTAWTNIGYKGSASKPCYSAPMRTNTAV